MFRVRIGDLCGDGQLCEFDTPLETLAEVEHLVQADIATILHTDDIVLVHDDELVYKVYAGGCSAGIVAIESL